MTIIVFALLFLSLPAMQVHGELSQKEIVDVYLKGNDGGKLPKQELIRITEKEAEFKGKYAPKQVIPISHIAQLVFSGGSHKDKGIVLKSSNLSGIVKSYQNGQWHFDLPFGELIVREPGEVISVNFVETTASTSSQNNDRLSINVLEWIYDHNLFRKEGNWSLDIKKIMIAENMIVLTTEIYSSDPKIINSHGCFVACMATDNGGRNYNEIWTKLFDVPSEIEKKELLIRCPMPSESAESVRFRIRTGPDKDTGGYSVQRWYDDKNWDRINSYKLDFCSDNDWHELPEIAMPLLNRN